MLNFRFCIYHARAMSCICCPYRQCNRHFGCLVASASDIVNLHDTSGMSCCISAPAEPTCCICSATVKLEPCELNCCTASCNFAFQGPFAHLCACVHAVLLAGWGFLNYVAPSLLCVLFGVPSGAYRLHHCVMHHVVSKQGTPL